MKYSAINIQGNIITSDILEKIRREDIRYQKPIDFGLNPTSSVRDEISLAWSLASSHWKAFQQKREGLREYRYRYFRNPKNVVDTISTTFRLRY